MGYFAHTPPCSTLGISWGRADFILLQYKMNKNKYTIISAIIVGLLLSLLCLGSTLLGKSEPINTDLQRLDEISKELTQVASEVKETEIQIANLNEHLSGLKAQETNLNDEATAIFYKMMSPGLIPCNTWEREPGMLNESWDAQVMPELSSTTEHEKFKELATDYWLDAWTIWEVENHYWIREGVILCITVAETSGWNRWAGWKNIWSVGSNDRGDRPTYALMEAWLEAIGKTLNNKYLWKHQTLWCLSNAGNCTEWLTARYATSDGNRERNMVACLSSIYGTIDPATFSIRR